MRTPSLRRRVTRSGVAVFAVLVLGLDVFVYVTLRARLEDTLAEVLAARAELAVELDDLVESDELAARLQALGVPVLITTADGQVITAEPATPRFQQGPPGPGTGVPQPRVSTVVDLADGGTAEVFATRAGVNATLRGMLLLLVIGTALALLAAVLLFRRSARMAMAPLDQVVETARRTTAGMTGERLDPDEPETELGRMAFAYDQMLDALESALEQARAAEERTRRFVDDAAHQLRTPIAGVRSSVESLLREPDPAERDQLMGNLVREASRSSRVLHALLVLARSDHDEVPQLVATDLVQLCREEVERAQGLAPHLTIRVHRDAPSVVLDADGGALREVVANLLDNARRHARAAVDLTIARDEETVVLRVRDDGDGVPHADRERIFDRFVTADHHGGSGLGLAIGRAVARGHGGDLVYDDGFVLRLPDAAG